MADKLFNVTEISFQTILPVWRDLLWPGRQSEIKPVSTMKFLGGYDLDIRKYTDQARFWGIYGVDGQLNGVFSGHPCSATQYRGRGLYVRQSQQLRGIGRTLVETVVQAASDAKREMCWCIPRVRNEFFFRKCGFTVMSPPFNEGVEFGPNIYVAHAVIPF